MRKFAVLVNRNKPGVYDVADALRTHLESYQMQTICADATNTDTDGSELVSKFEDVELAFVLGGDGTLLGVARHLAKWGIPLLGINLGHLGFLSEADPQSLEETVKRVVNRDYDLEHRLMLEASIYRSGAVTQSYTALNDVGIGKGSFGRMLTVKVFVDGVLADSFRGDGVIVSTPTGSTAYSLSCGGPIVVPHLQAILITPICAHTLVSRPCVIGSEQTVRLLVDAAHDEVGLTVDGQVGVSLSRDDEVVICRSPAEATLVKWRDRQFFQVLRTKLRTSNDS